MGASMLVGGLGRDAQKFDRTAASAQSLMLLLASRRARACRRSSSSSRAGAPVARSAERQRRFGHDLETMSLRWWRWCCSLLRRRPVVLAQDPPRPVQPAHGRTASARSTHGWSRAPRASCSLALAGVAVGVMSEILVGLDRGGVARRIGLIEFFVGDHRRGDRRQRGRALGRRLLRRQGQDGPVGGHRDRLERPDRAVRRARARACVVLRAGRIRWRSCSTASSSAAIMLAVIIANHVTNEGESTWFEGVQLLAVYVVLGHRVLLRLRSDDRGGAEGMPASSRSSGSARAVVLVGLVARVRILARGRARAARLERFDRARARRLVDRHVSPGGSTRRRRRRPPVDQLQVDVRPIVDHEDGSRSGGLNYAPGLVRSSSTSKPARAGMPGRLPSSSDSRFAISASTSSGSGRARPCGRCAPARGTGSRREAPRRPRTGRARRAPPRRPRSALPAAARRAFRASSICRISSSR